MSVVTSLSDPNHLLRPPLPTYRPTPLPTTHGTLPRSSGENSAQFDMAVCVVRVALCGASSGEHSAQFRMAVCVVRVGLCVVQVQVKILTQFCMGCVCCACGSVL